MKRITLAIVLAVSSFLGAHDLPEKIANVRIITEQYPPLNYLEDDELKGMSVEILHLMYDQMGLPFPQIEVMPWARGFHLAQSDHPVMLFTMSRTNAREDLFQWVGHTHTARTLLVTYEGSGIEQYDPKTNHDERVLAVTSDVTEYVMKELGYPGEKLDLVESIETMLMLAKRQRAKLLSVSEASFNVLKTTDEYKDVNFVTLAVTREIKGQFAFSLAVDPEVVAAFQQALDAIRPEQQEIVARYGITY